MYRPERDVRSPVHKRVTHAREFQLKRARVLATGLAALLSLGVALSPVGAQSRTVFRADPAQPNSQRGVQVQRQPTVVVVPQPFVSSLVFPRQPVAFITIPAILLSDGTVLADFGLGYAPVTRACNSQVVVLSGSQPRVIAGNGVVLSGAPTYTQPVPNQATASQQMLPSNQSRYPILTSASQTSCFSRDGGGSVFVVRQ